MIEVQRATNLSSHDLETFEQGGYLLLRGVYSASEIALIRETFMRQADTGPVEGLSQMPEAFSREDPLNFYPRMMNPHRHPDKTVGRVALDFLLAPRPEVIVLSLIGKEPLAVQTMFYFKPPGARGQALHQDNFYLRVQPGTCLAAWLAVDDVNAENSGMKVVPGTQRYEIVCPEEADLNFSFTKEHVPVPEGMQAVHVDMKAGDVLFFNGSLIYSSTPNTSRDRFRYSLIAHYVPKSCEEVTHWYKPLLNFSQLVVEKVLASGGGPCGTEAAVLH